MFRRAWRGRCFWGCLHTLEVLLKVFTDYRRWFWLGGMATLILGFIVAALLLPSTSDPLRGLGPSVSVPKMHNVPPPEQRVKIDLEQQKK